MTGGATNEIRIDKKKLLLVEGRDAAFFLVWACRKYRAQDDVQVIDFGGIRELGTFIKTLAQVEHFDEVDTLVIARDAETHAEGAVTSMQTALGNNGLPVPMGAFSYAENSGRRSALLVFPGPHFKEGALENLCLDIVKNDPIMSCVNDYLACLQRDGTTLTVPHKRKLHAFLAGKDKKFVGATVGQASYRNAWNPEHPALQPFKAVIEAM